jgi:DNA gyrase/topoisomerase IV subunit B
LIPYGKQPVHYPCELVGPVQKLASSTLTTVQGSECLIVEGDSAAKSVDQVRDGRCQAILALQGKPLNAAKASRDAAFRNEVFLRIFETLLGHRTEDARDVDVLYRKLQNPTACVYDKLVLLMDPDADGIHCSVLMMGFFHQFAPALIGAGRVIMIRPPMFVFRFTDHSLQDAAKHPVASTPEHAIAIEQALRQHGIEHFEKTRHRGLGSLDSPLLRRTCVDARSRNASCLTLEDAKTAIEMFGGLSQL